MTLVIEEKNDSKKDWKKRIKLEHIFHESQKHIKLDFFYDKDLISEIKKIEGMKWNKENKYWHVENNREKLKEIFSYLKGKAWIDGRNFFKNDSKKPEITESEKTFIEKSCPVEYIEKLKEKKYSENTIKSYTKIFTGFINHFNQKSIEEIDENDIENYSSYLLSEKQVSESYNKQVKNAVKFYFQRVKAA